MKHLKLYEEFLNENMKKGSVWTKKSSKKQKLSARKGLVDALEGDTIKITKVSGGVYNAILTTNSGSFKGDQDSIILKDKDLEDWEMNEAAKGDYQVYHNTYSSAVDAALEYAKSKGYEIVQDDVWDKISVGPKKPSDGQTNKATIGLLKGEKPQRKALHIQIYGMGDRYELNAYIN